MSTNKDLFKEAIADAKAVREAALVNAKAALEEALTPKLQSMLAAKLNEMNYEMEEEGMKSEEDMEEGFTSSHEENSDANLDFNLEEEKDLEEDFDLSEILAELNEAEEKEEKEEEEKEEEEVEVADMSVEDLKDLIKDIVSQEMEAEEEETSAEEAGEEEADMEMGDEEGSEDEIDLEELLAELDSLNENEEKEKLDEIEPISLTLGITAAVGAALAKYLKNDAMKVAASKLGKKSVDELTPEEKKAAEQAVRNAISNAGEKVGLGAGKSLPVDEAKKAKAKKEKEEKEEMKEAIATIKTLRSELNETNLLNAKLLYVNKIFKAKNLTESQKLKVIASFDKATNVKEAKVVFESLNSALSTAPKKALKESFGFASKAAGVAHKSTIVESNDVITRMQKLANIIK